MTTRVALLAMPLLLGLLTPAALGHDFSVTRALVLLKSDESYVVDLHVHLDALALGLPQQTPPTETSGLLLAMTPSELEAALSDLERLLQKRVRIKIDGEKVLPLIHFPEFEHPLPPPSDGEPTVLGATARITGRIPPGAAEITFGASRAFQAIELAIFEQTTGRVLQHLLVPGSDSPPFRINEQAAEGTPQATPQPATGDGVTFGQYLYLGFIHIVPRGLDHILFVLGLYLLSTKLRPLVWQISMFTIAHTLTLALSINGWVQLSGSIVEPLIAASIVYVAVENIWFREMTPWRAPLVFAFGLLHGLGFAGVLNELGLPTGRFVEALAGFNIGVEFGQLAVVGVAFAVLGWFRTQSWYRTMVVIPGSLLIALMGAYWVVERTLL